MVTRGPDPKVSDYEILECFETVNKPFITPSDIAQRVDLSRTRIHQRMESLKEKEKINRSKVGNAVIYWLSDSDRDGST